MFVANFIVASVKRFRGVGEKLCSEDVFLGGSDTDLGIFRYRPAPLNPKASQYRERCFCHN